MTGTYLVRGDDGVHADAADDDHGVAERDVVLDAWRVYEEHGHRDEDEGLEEDDGWHAVGASVGPEG
jgi:hypothetical protein